jgi:hypothetical protein
MLCAFQRFTIHFCKYLNRFNHFSDVAIHVGNVAVHFSDLLFISAIISIISAIFQLLQLLYYSFQLLFQKQRGGQGKGGMIGGRGEVGEDVWGR